MKLPLIAIAFCVAAPLQAMAQANVLANGDFAATPILSAGQSALPANQSKLITTNTSNPLYANSISGIADWTNSFSNGTRDAGLSRVSFGGTGTQQYAFINNWNARLSQVSSLEVQAGFTYTADIDVGLKETGAAGVFQLWAGTPNTSNPDLFPSTAVLLAQVSFAGTTWAGAAPNQTLTNGQWHDLQLTYTAPGTGGALGQPLTLSLMTTERSQGPTYWDNASLTISAVPEPQAYLMMLLGLGAMAGVARKRRQA